LNTTAEEHHPCRSAYLSAPAGSVAIVGSAVVLLGPPGSGKSTVGAALGRLGLRWREWEPSILERWRSRDDFIAEKRTALPWLHDEIIRWIDSDRTVAVIETTGLSDAPLLDRLQGSLVVRLDVSERVAMSRVGARQPNQHLTDDIESNRAIWRAFYEVVASSRRVDIAIDTEVTSGNRIAARIADIVRY
jgi:shikimate kinase